MLMVDALLWYLPLFMTPEQTTIIIVSQGFPDVMVAGSMVKGSWLTALLFGFSSAMLGVSGFESSSRR